MEGGRDDGWDGQIGWIGWKERDGMALGGWMYWKDGVEGWHGIALDGLSGWMMDDKTDRQIISLLKSVSQNYPKYFMFFRITINANAMSTDSKMNKTLIKTNK